MCNNLLFNIDSNTTGRFYKTIKKSAYLEALPFFAISETASFWDNLEDLTRKPYDATSAPAWAQEWRTAKIKICDLSLKIHTHMILFTMNISMYIFTYPEVVKSSACEPLSGHIFW